MPTTAAEDDGPLQGREEIIYTTVVCAVIVLIGALLVASTFLYCYLRQSHRVQLQTKSSIYHTMRGPTLSSDATTVYLKSYKYSDSKLVVAI